MNDELKILSVNYISHERVNIELAKAKNLITDNSCERYQLVQSLYKKAFDAYLVKNTDISKLDELIDNSNLYFGAASYNEMDDYQKFSYINSKYIYVRSFIFIEKLDDNDLKILCDRIVNTRYNIDEELLNMVERTYRTVITDNFINGIYKEKGIMVMYSLPGVDALLSNAFDNDTLVFNLRYGKNPVQMSDQEYIKNLEDKDAFIEKIKETEIAKLGEVMGCKAGLIVVTI